MKISSAGKSNFQQLLLKQERSYITVKDFQKVDNDAVDVESVREIVKIGKSKD